MVLLFQPSAAELVAASKAFLDPASALASGLHFEGQKYFVLQADEDRVIGKKAADGFFIYKTVQGEYIRMLKRYELHSNYFSVYRRSLRQWNFSWKLFCHDSQSGKFSRSFLTSHRPNGYVQCCNYRETI